MVAKWKLYFTIISLVIFVDVGGQQFLQTTILESRNIGLEKIRNKIFFRMSVTTETPPKKLETETLDSFVRNLQDFYYKQKNCKSQTNQPTNQPTKQTQRRR